MIFEALKTIALLCQLHGGGTIDFAQKLQTECQVRLINCYLAEKAQVELALMSCVARPK